MTNWSPTSWQDYKYEQSAHYADQNILEHVVNELSSLPPLVSKGEIDNLKHALAKASRGEVFILQGGDCAESFADCRDNVLKNKLKIVLQMSLVLIYGMRKPVVRVGRIAGQYAKPRSSDVETRDGITLPSYRGDLVNSPEFTETARTPNPKRMLTGYSRSAMTLNYIRALLAGGFANLQHPQKWNLEFVEHSAQADEYSHIVNAIGNALDFMKTIDGLQSSKLDTVDDFFTSHEALHLHYEQALTREMKNGQWYNFSTHLPWIGMRTATIDGAHVEFLSGIQNPVGIKIGPSAKPEMLIELLEKLNPKHEEGKIMLITRLGADKVSDYLPGFIKAVQNAKIPVCWSCDPMHGNTETTEEGIKTRHFDNILKELDQAIDIHQAHHSHLGGVHFELTGDNVTECIGGARGLSSKDLSDAYHTLVDPRLNYEQSLEMAIQISRKFKSHA